MKKLVITGYRATELGIFDKKHPGIQVIKTAIQDKLSQLAEEGLEWILVSGQQGVEVWAAEIVVELKKQGFPLKLSLTPPFEEFASRMKPEKQAEFQELILAADFYQPLTKGGYQGAWQFQERDKFLLRNTDGALIIYDEEQPASPKYFLELVKRYQERKPDFVLFQVDAYDLNEVGEQIKEKEGYEYGQ